MAMTEGQMYRCQNRECGCEIKVLRTSINARATPQCCCGGEMKKPYRKPAWRAVRSEIELLTSPRSNKN
jgi:hypothetical protein